MANITSNPASITNKKYQQGYVDYELLDDRCINKKLGMPITYRSSYELKFIKWLIQNPKVTKWGIEVFPIRYTTADGKVHRYFPDFYVEMGDKKYVIEIKPKNQTSKPVFTSKTSLKTKHYQIKEFEKNKRKWNAALAFCKERDIEFKLVTEAGLSMIK